MKITIVLGPFHAMPPEGCGAVEKVWYDLAHAFARHGHQVTLIGKGARPANVDGGDGTPAIVGVRGLTATGNIWLDLAKDFVYALLVSRRAGRCDVLVTNSFWLPVLVRLHPRLDRKLVVHVARFPKYQMGLYRNAHFVQAISTAVAQEIVRQTPALADRIVVLPYPIDLGRFRPPAVPRDYRATLTLLYLGRVHPEKGVDLLIRAFRRIVAAGRNVRLRIVGPVEVEHGGGGAAYTERLRALSHGLPVEFVEALTDPDAVVREYHAAHCFCYPSLAEKGEALGLAVLEAMAAGLPVVVSDLACFRDFVEPGVNGLVFDHRSAPAEVALAETLITMLGDPAAAAGMGANAARRAGDYEFEEVARQYVDLLAAAVGGAPGTAQAARDARSGRHTRGRHA